MSGKKVIYLEADALYLYYLLSEEGRARENVQKPHWITNVAVLPSVSATLDSVATFHI